MPQPRVTIKIPKHLYDHLARLIEGGGFSSVTEFIVFVLRDIAYLGPAARAGAGPEPPAQIAGTELDAIKEKLRRLGYL